MSRCRLCGEERELVKAHAIPEAFFRVLRSGGETPLLISDAPHPFPRRAPIGVYDTGILCGECERTFDRVDSYAAEVLITRFEELFKPVRFGERIALQAEGIDQELLLRFLVATLWRASVSTHPFYTRVQLGRYEAEAKMAADVAYELPSMFAAVLSAWPVLANDGSVVHGLMDPFAERWDGVNAYRLYLGRVVAYIKVDRRPFRSPLVDLTLRRHDLTFVIQREFAASKDFAAMVKTAKQSRKAAEIARARGKARI